MDDDWEAPIWKLRFEAYSVDELGDFLGRCGTEGPGGFALAELTTRLEAMSPLELERVMSAGGEAGVLAGVELDRQLAAKIAAAG